MRFSHLTPDQYTNLGAHVDTLLVCSYSIDPLTPNAPHAAAQWIAQGLIAQTTQTFSGRVAAVELGPLLGNAVFCSDLQLRIETLARRPIRHVVLLTDRTLVTGRSATTSESGVSWLMLDWWQWLRQRVPRDRLQDAWVYLAYTHPNYAGSREHRELRQAATVAAQMTREGQALLSRMAAWVAKEVEEVWRIDNESHRLNTPLPVSNATSHEPSESEQLQ